MHLVKALAVGFKYRWWTGLQRAFAMVGVMWLGTELPSFLFKTAEDWFKSHGPEVGIGMAAAAIITFIASIYAPKCVTFDIPTTQTDDGTCQERERKLRHRPLHSSAGERPRPMRRGEEDDGGNPHQPSHYRA